MSDWQPRPTPEQRAIALSIEIRELAGLDEFHHSMRMERLEKNLRCLSNMFREMSRRSNELDITLFDAVLWCQADEAARVRMRSELTEEEANLIECAIDAAALEIEQKRSMPRAA